MNLLWSEARLRAPEGGRRAESVWKRTRFCGRLFQAAAADEGAQEHPHAWR
jgi:hypothetical protein